MRKEKLITKKDMGDFFELIILLFCFGIGYLIAFVIFDYPRIVAGTITGAITGILYFIIMKFIFKVKDPMKFR